MFKLKSKTNINLVTTCVVNEGVCALSGNVSNLSVTLVEGMEWSRVCVGCF